MHQHSLEPSDFNTSCDAYESMRVPHLDVIARDSPLRVHEDSDTKKDRGDSSWHVLCRCSQLQWLRNITGTLVCCDVTRDEWFILSVRGYFWWKWTNEQMKHGDLVKLHRCMLSVFYVMSSSIHASVCLSLTELRWSSSTANGWMHGAQYDLHWLWWFPDLSYSFNRRLHFSLF